MHELLNLTVENKGYFKAKKLTRCHFYFQVVKYIDGVFYFSEIIFSRL